MTRIRKALLGSPVLLGVAALAGTASADVFLEATITKNKDKTVTEEITKDKDVFVTVVSEPNIVGAAESEALANQVIENNEVDHSNGSSNELDFLATMTDSASDNAGVTQVNQDVGNMGNQGNVLAVAVHIGDDKFADAQGSAEQRNNDNSVHATGVSLTTDNPQREARIDDSVNDNNGVTQVNQNAGAMNNQLNALSAGLGRGSAVALSEADLGQFNSDNTVESFVTVKVGTVVDSVNNNSGVTSVNQSTGNMNNQGTVLSLAGATSAGLSN